MAYDVTLIPGDGVGPELAEAARLCIDATGVAINWDVQEAGVDVMAKLGTPVPDSVIESCRKHQGRAQGPDHHARSAPGSAASTSTSARRSTSTPASALARSTTGVRTFFSGRDVDLVIVRENTEDLYLGCEFEQGKPETAELIADIKRLNGKTIRPDSGISIKPISITGTGGSSSTPSSTPASTSARR